MLKVLVVGKGGREHALLTAMNRSPTAAELYSFPGSDAIFSDGVRAAPGVHDLPTLMQFVIREKMDLVVAGEESYLVTGEGLANLCTQAGIPCWGPPKESAQLEASKEFAKSFLRRHGIPTARYTVAGTIEEAEVAAAEVPIVLKFDGLAAGKGVAVCHSPEEVSKFLQAVFVKGSFGRGRVVIEECMTGPEISIFASVVDGKYQILCPARDYKRVYDGDRGPNTGGMGAVASPELVSQSVLEQIEREVIQPTMAGLLKDTLSYRGFLYFGLMLTPEGPKVVEYNCRFGDPECEAVMPLLTGDLVRYMLEGAQGRLCPELISFQKGWSVCKILASAGYPISSHRGDLITGLEDVREAQVFHCGTTHRAGGYLTSGGRVLAVVAQAASRAQAVEAVEREARKISFAGQHSRSDIGRLHFD